MKATISPKQQKILAFPYSDFDAIICDGAVRSGKTSIMTVAFVDWAMKNFSGCCFGICGKTVDSATKNIIKPFMAMSYARERYTMQWKKSEKILDVRRGYAKNFFEVFGGKDESSFQLIQGRTLAGVMLDEVVLMPESFVNQALARCSVNGAKLWFSCNPGSPMHWFNEEWIKQRDKHNALYLRFTMRDNPGLSEKTLSRYENMYHGVFYQRYILGEWTIAEGLIYPMFDNVVPTEPREYTQYYISMDYGIQNPTAMILFGLCGGIWYAVREYYHSGRETGQQKTDQQYYDELEKLAGDLPIKNLIIDPSATSFIALCNQKKRFRVWRANNDVIDGIQHTASVINERKLLVNDCCENMIREFGLYSWDKDATEDRPIKENDHAMDLTRYFVNTVGIWRKPIQYTSIFGR